MDWVTIGTIAGIEVLNRIRKMGLVIGGVQVHAVPAGREKDLRAHAVWAVVVEEVGALRPIRVVVMSAAEV